MGKGRGRGGKRGRNRGDELRFELVRIMKGAGRGVLGLSFEEGGGQGDRRRGLGGRGNRGRRGSSGGGDRGSCWEAGPEKVAWNREA